MAPIQPKNLFAILLVSFVICQIITSASGNPTKTRTTGGGEDDDDVQEFVS